MVKSKICCQNQSLTEIQIFGPDDDSVTAEMYRFHGHLYRLLYTSYVELSLANTGHLNILLFYIFENSSECVV